jgi:hypothetical protein
MSRASRVWPLILLCGMAGQAMAAPAARPAKADAISVLVGELSIDRYKADIKALTQYGDRRQGTKRNRDAIDWIESQLKSYDCPTARLSYIYDPAKRFRPAVPAGGGVAVGGGRPRGFRRPTAPNTDPNAQRDPKLRQLDSEVAPPGKREEVYCTKTGTGHPDEMYIVSAHMDGIGYGEAANDDGSGTALVMELARVLNRPGVRTDRSVRFILWNNEETGLDGARAYVAARRALQGKEDPPHSGRFPEPKWLGVIQHDMVMFDHGMPRADGTVSREQRPEADINVEFQSASRSAAQSEKLAWALQQANDNYATDYPAVVGPHMTNTDSEPFQDLVASVSVRENERGTQIGNGWDPQWHQPTDLYSTYGEQDFRLGLNAAQTTLAAVARLAGASLAAGPK